MGRQIELKKITKVFGKLTANSEGILQLNLERYMD